jgi:hypothetical protein
VRKNTVYGLNGLRPTLRVGTFKSSTAFRALAPTASFRGPLCFAFGQKIWHTNFFSSKPNFNSQSLADLLRLRKAGALRFICVYPAWSTCGCWLEKIHTQTRCCVISVLLRRCLAHRLKNCDNSFQKAKRRRSWQLSRYPMLPTPNMLYQLP